MSEVDDVVTAIQNASSDEVARSIEGEFLEQTDNRDRPEDGEQPNQ